MISGGHGTSEVNSVDTLYINCLTRWIEWAQWHHGISKLQAQIGVSVVNAYTLASSCIGFLRYRSAVCVGRANPHLGPVEQDRLARSLLGHGLSFRLAHGFHAPHGPDHLDLRAQCRIGVGLPDHGRFHDRVPAISNHVSGYCRFSSGFSADLRRRNRAAAILADITRIGARLAICAHCPDLHRLRRARSEFRRQPALSHPGTLVEIEKGRRTSLTSARA